METEPPKRKRGRPRKVPQDGSGAQGATTLLPPAIEAARRAYSSLGTPPRLRRVPGKLTPAVFVAICDRIAQGTPISHACYLEGVTPESLHAFRERDPIADWAVNEARATAIDALSREFFEFLRAYRKERAAAVLLTWMERADPHNFAPPPKELRHSGPEGGPIALQAVAKMPETVAEALERVEALRKALAARQHPALEPENSVSRPLSTDVHTPVEDVAPVLEGGQPRGTDGGSSE